MLSIQPKNQIETEIFSLWKELNPVGAYLDGIDECVGRIFEGQDKQVTEALRKIKSVKKKTEDRLVLKILDSFEIGLTYEEPFAMPNGVLSSLFGYMVKEGVKHENMNPLLQSSLRALRNSRRRLSSKSWSVPLRILTQIACDGLKEVLDVVSSGTRDAEVKRGIHYLQEEVKVYAKIFKVEGFKEGRYEDVMEVLSRVDPSMGRAHIYEKWVRMAYDYTETAQELIRKGEQWIREELPNLKQVTEKLAKLHGCEPTVKAVTATLAKKDSLKTSRLIEKTQELRRAFQPYANKFVVGINPNYETDVIETPSYLAKLLPSAAAFGFNQLTRKPKQLYLVTTDEKSAPMSSLADLINTWVHEEMGHDLHFSNTAMRYGAKPTLLERLSTSHSGPISEGLSFQREMEFLEAIKETVTKKKRSPEEKKVLEYLERNGGLMGRLLELEFITRKWRLIRFLRVVGDARINSQTQSLPDFLEWAEKTTGVEKKTVYYQLFPAHQTHGPGYATTYAVIGQEIARIERKIKGDRRKLGAFTTYGCSTGYPPRTIYLDKLRKFAASLR